MYIYIYQIFTTHHVCVTNVMVYTTCTICVVNDYFNKTCKLLRQNTCICRLRLYFYNFCTIICLVHDLVNKTFAYNVCGVRLHIPHYLHYSVLMCVYICMFRNFSSIIIQLLDIAVYFVVFHMVIVRPVGG